VSVLALLLFPLGLLIHETAHVGVLDALGVGGRLVVRPWSVFGLPFAGVHAQPGGPLTPSRQALVNFGGPALAAVVFASPLTWLRRGAFWTALAVNTAILGFFAAIETAYVAIEDGLGIDADLLTTAELNYGVPLVLIALAAWLPVRAASRYVPVDGDRPSAWSRGLE
jgi:hypothetical protein